MDPWEQRHRSLSALPNRVQNKSVLLREPSHVQKYHLKCYSPRHSPSLPSVSPVITRPLRWAPLLCWLPSMTLCWCVRHSILSCKCRLVERTERKTRNNKAKLSRKKKG